MPDTHPYLSTYTDLRDHKALNNLFCSEYNIYNVLSLTTVRSIIQHSVFASNRNAELYRLTIREYTVLTSIENRKMGDCCNELLLDPCCDNAR